MSLKFYLDVQNGYNFKSQSEDITVREEDSNGRFLTTDGGTSYILHNIKNTAGTILSTFGIQMEF